MTEQLTCPVCGGSGTVDGAPSALEVERVLGAQRVSDRDQAAGDEDQTWSDHDQTASDRDQASADLDQISSDHDLAEGGDAVVHRASSAARSRTSDDRQAVSKLRDESASARHASAEERDRAADLRDRSAEARDLAAAANELDLDLDPQVSADELLRRAEQARARAAADRARAADDRARAALDRRRAAEERAESLARREEALRALQLAATDELTGVSTRKFGLDGVAREIDRASRTRTSLALAFIDVTRLKEVNDLHGHGAGDELLRRVGLTLQSNLRSYDVILRYGGDEFVCALPNLSLSDARRRLEVVAAILAAADADHPIAVGFAAYEPGDVAQTLIDRADGNLLETRRGGSSR